MTIITKKFTEKQPDKAEILLVAEDEHSVDILDPSVDDEDLIQPKGLCGFSFCGTVGLFAAAMAILVFGSMGGLYLYEEYGRETTRYHGWCQIPYGGPQAKSLTSEEVYHNDFIESNILNSFMQADRLRGYNDNRDISNYIREHFEISLDDDRYEKIDVPDFEDSRPARFIHDFNANKTGIIDPTSKRCFIMLLDRNAVLPPKSLIDLINKMWSGHYDVNMNIVKQKMQVVLPAIEDFSDVGVYITRECQNIPSYRLEMTIHDVVKRSTDNVPKIKFTQFAGKYLQELDIVNFDDVLQHEEKEKNKRSI